MRDEDRGHPHRLRPDPHPAAVFLNVEAVGLVVVAAACFGAGAILSSGLCLVLAAVAGGLAASIAEGLPRSGAAVVGFEGVTVAFAVTWLSRPAAAAVLAVTVTAWFCLHRRPGRVGQIRRPVSRQ